MKMTRKILVLMGITILAYSFLGETKSKADDKATPTQQTLGVEFGSEAGSYFNPHYSGDSESENEHDSDFKSGMKETGSEIKKGAKATGRGFKKAGHSIKHFFTGDKKKK